LGTRLPPAAKETFEKVSLESSKLSLKSFILINGEVRALSVYEEPRGISDRLPLSLAPAAILVPPPKMAFKIVWRGGLLFFIGDFWGTRFFLGDFLKKVPQTPQKLSKRGYFRFRVKSVRYPFMRNRMGYLIALSFHLLPLPFWYHHPKWPLG